MGKYKICVNKGNKESTRKGTKKDISTFSLNNLHWYHNGDKNMAIGAKNPIFYNDAVS